MSEERSDRRSSPIARQPQEPRDPRVSQEADLLLLGRTRLILRFALPLTLLYALLTLLRLLPQDPPLLLSALIVELVSIAGFSLLAGVVEWEWRKRESREPGVVSRAAPTVLALLILLSVELLALQFLGPFGWAAIFGIAVCAVAVTVPMPPGRLLLPGILSYGLLLFATLNSSAQSFDAAGVLLSAALALLIALYASRLLSRQIILTCEQRLALEQRNSELRSAVERSRRLMSIVSHDVRAPLGSVVQLLDFVEERRERFSPKELSEISDDVTASVRNSYQLLDNLLSWARSVAGSVEVNRDAWHVDELIQAGLTPVVLAARRKGIHLARELDLGLEAQVDRQMIEVSLRNVISNAVKFTPEGGTVRIRCGYAFEEGVVLEIVDSGVGMGQEDLDRLLTPGDGGKSRLGTAGERGSGVGFELAREFVVLNGGRIEVESARGEGTTVRIYLPGRYNQEFAARSATEEQLEAEEP